MIKRTATVSLCLFLLAAGPAHSYAASATDTAVEENSASVLDGLQEEDGISHYYKNGKLVTDKIVTLDGSKYYFDKNGEMASGILVIDKKFYCFRANGKYNAAKTTKIRKAAKYEKPFDKVKKLIGKPNKTKYYDSCYGNGKDGVLSYDNFTVYTFKPAQGKEIFMSAE